MKKRKNIYDTLIIRDYEKGSDLLKDFIDDVEHITRHQNSDIDRVSIYANSELTYIFLRTLMSLECYTVGSLHFSRFYFDDDYKAPYCLSVYDDKMMVVEPAYNAENRPYCLDGIAYMYQEDCDQDLIDAALNNDVTTILFGLDDQGEDAEPDEEDDNLELTVCIDNLTDEIHGFEAKSETDKGYYEYSYFTTDVLTEKEIDDLIDKIGM